MKKYLLILLLLIPVSAWAWGVLLIGAGSVEGGGACTATLDQQTNTSASSVWLYQHTYGGVLSCSSSDEICGIEIDIDGYVGTRTVYFRIGTSADLSTPTESGSASVTATGTMTIELDSTVTGQTTWYWAIGEDGDDYNNRVGIVSYNGNEDCYRGDTYDDWSIEVYADSEIGFTILGVE